MFLDDGRERLGIVAGEEVLDAPAEYPDMRAFIRGGEAALRAARAALPKAARRPLAAVRLAPPIRPATMLCSGSNYRDHNKEKANTPISGKEPEFFVKTADCVIGHDEKIIYDERLTKKLDAETELAIVIGKPGRHIPVERALEHVFGYTIVNDVTARDLQALHGQWFKGKSLDTSCPIGPVVVCRQAIADPGRLSLSMHVNGELRQQANTSSMVFDVAEIIAQLSRGMTLLPGDIIATGTPSGVGLGLTPPVFLQPGDVMLAEIEGIGRLENTVKEHA